METIGMRLKLARIRNKFKQDEVIERLKNYNVSITQSYLSKIENDINEPNIEQLKAFSKIYHCNIIDLIFSKEEQIDLDLI